MTHAMLAAVQSALLYSANLPFALRQRLLRAEDYLIRRMCR